MTIESTKTKAIYQANGETREWPVPFGYSRVDDLRLVHTDAVGVETAIVSNYRVNVNASGDTSVTYPVTGQALPFGVKLTVHRSTPLTQIVDLIYGGDFNPDVLEKDGFDRAVMMIQEVREEVDRAVKVSITSEDKPKTAENIYAEVNKIADRAEDAVTRAGEAVVRSEDARDRAEAAAEKAVSNIGDLKNLSIAVDDAPHGQVASGDYNADTGMLTLHVPAGPSGKAGRDGTNGTDGKDGKDGKNGEPGAPGVIMDIQRGMFALEVVDGYLVLFHNEQDRPPDLFIDADGYLIWEQE